MQSAGYFNSRVPQALTSPSHEEPPPILYTLLLLNDGQGNLARYFRALVPAGLLHARRVNSMSVVFGVRACVGLCVRAWVGTCVCVS